MANIVADIFGAYNFFKSERLQFNIFYAIFSQLLALDTFIMFVNEPYYASLLHYIRRHLMGSYLILMRKL